MYIYIYIYKSNRTHVYIYTWQYKCSRPDMRNYRAVTVGATRPLVVLVHTRGRRVSEQAAPKGLSVVGVTKMGNTLPRAGLEPTYLAFRASGLSLHHICLPDVTTIPTLTCV